MYFEAHGNIDFMITKSCVINRPNAPFNEEGINVLFTTLLSQIEKRGMGSWVLIEILGEQALPTPEAMTALVARYQNCFNKGCIQIHSVCANSVQKQFLMQVAEKTDLDIFFHDTEETALSTNEQYLAN